MFKKKIECAIRKRLQDSAQQNALDFVAYLRESKMQFERCRKGYWADKFYWMIKHKNEYVCFIAINGAAYETEPEGWIIWSDDSSSDCLENFPLDEHTKEVAWKHIDFCGKCGGDCSPGVSKTIFGKEFNHVCRTPMIFINPDSEALGCAKKIVEIRKNDILQKIHNRG